LICNVYVNYAMLHYLLKIINTSAINTVYKFVLSWYNLKFGRFTCCQQCKTIYFIYEISYGSFYTYITLGILLCTEPWHDTRYVSKARDRHQISWANWLNERKYTLKDLNKCALIVNSIYKMYLVWNEM